MCGGNGARLWPISRSNLPKQFININGLSLLEHTISRLDKLVPNSKISIVATDKFRNNLSDFSNRGIDIILEPCSRNTANGILYSLLSMDKAENDDPVVIFFPADHYIENSEKFKQAINNLIDKLNWHNGLGLIGIKPLYPAIGYGYISYSINEDNVKMVQAFHEKPNISKAIEYYQKDNMLWNSGIVGGKMSAFLKNFKEFAPNILLDMHKFFNGAMHYSDLQEISFDYAILEHAKNLIVVDGQFDWSDIGTLESFLVSQNNDESRMINLNSAGNLVNTDKKIVVFIDVNDICLVETDDVIVVSKRTETERIKEVRNILKQKNLEKYL